MWKLYKNIKTLTCLLKWVWQFFVTSSKSYVNMLYGTNYADLAMAARKKGQIMAQAITLLQQKYSYGN